MKNSMKFIMLALIVLSLTSCEAQKIENAKVVAVSIQGDCDICKNTIETAGQQKKLAAVSWDKESKIATITFDSLKTSISGILKKIALAGFDNEMYMAPDDTYAQLAECCQYPRAKKELIVPEMEEITAAVVVEEAEMTMPEKPKVEEIVKPKETKVVVKTDYLKLVFDNYFKVKNALVQSDVNLTSLKAAELVKALDNVQMNELEMDVHMVWMKVMDDLKATASKISKSKDQDVQRAQFISLSTNIYALIKIAKYQEPVYYQFCPMANDGKGANWLSKEETIKNPYYGSQMLNCGKTVETIK